MKYTFDKNGLILCLDRAITGLACFLYQAKLENLEACRLARGGYALIASGCSTYGNLPGDNLSTYLVSNQQKDGGWGDVEETVWCLSYLNAFGDRYKQKISTGQKWLNSVRLPCGAWGKSERDQPRIPVTALIAALVPEVIDSSALKWLANQWEADLASPTQLTYKGAFFLLSQAHNKVSQDDELITRTISYLVGEQDEDGGFGPWKGHPVGSDPWSTGIVLWGLSRVGKLAPRKIIERALSWLKSKQLSNGLWPYHYLDDGAAMALIGISSVLPLLLEQ